MLTFDETSSGVFIVSVTPFDERGALDLAGVDRLVDFYLSKGVAGITILGMMGEAPKLSASESRIFVEAVCARVGGAVPVVVGVSSPGFASMQELTEAAMGAGASGVMVAPPATLRTDSQIVDYFRMTAETLGPVPFALQDFPLATGVQIAAPILRTIADEIPTCVMLKHEDWPGLDKITALRQAEAKGGRRISILVGNGGLFLPEELARGGDGAMTGFAYPEMMVQVCRLHAMGDTDAASDLFDAYLPLVRYEQQPGIGLATRKHVLHARGVIASARIRRPGRALSGMETAEVERLIARQARRLDQLVRIEELS
ncbi:dihydrodipicolinate synthase family protein [Lichenicoccus sp.]|uniref:dihydrodipicolinate synthase family protein n=1 Tax=Lichenicoccus sp. TaxID=2781899 RepID=UPI003D11E5B2